MSQPDPPEDEPSESPTESFDPAEDCDDPGYWEDNHDSDPPDAE